MNTMKKSIREQVYNKFGGKCAYTGQPLDEKWQVDHMHPRCYYQWRIAEGDPDHIDNLMPVCRIINHYKRSHTLESWRTYISTLHVRLKKLPRKTTVPATIRRKEYLLEVAALFGVSTDKPFNGKFYFETLPHASQDPE